MTQPKRTLLVAIAVIVFVAIAAYRTPPLRAVSVPDTKGTDFWLTFPTNYNSSPELSLFITGDTNTTGTVDIPSLSFSTPFSVTAGAVTTVSIPAGAQITTNDTVQSKAIHVTSLAEVTVYGLNRIQFTTDAYLGLPKDILGTEYIVLGYENVDVVNGTEFAVVGTENSTLVTITPSVTTGSHTAGVPYSFTMNQGDTYQLQNNAASPADLSGTIVTSDKPIAVFGGHECANIPAGYYACDHIVESMTPTSSWGKNFVTMPLATRLNGDTFRMIASTDGTSVSINGSVVATINRGQIYEQVISGAAQITADKPIMVAQYSNSSSFDGITSDPFEMVIPPYEQFLAGYTVTTPATGFSGNYINLVAPNAAVGNINLDGSAIPSGSFTAIGSSGFSGAQVPVSLGSHNLTGTMPFGAFVYGFADYDSYGYPGGMSLAPIAIATNLTLTPATATNPINTQHCVVATVSDQGSNPLAGIRIDFSVVGVNPTSGFGTSDSLGQVQFCFTGTNAGTDTITASVGTLTATATKTWTTLSTVSYMTGGGSVFTSGGTRVTHGGIVYCDAAQPSALEINWDKHKFHLNTVTSVTCSDAPGISPNPPDASFDTLVGTGTGLYDKKPATISFSFVDAGEPGTSDTVAFTITSGSTVLTVSGYVTFGNEQAHNQ